MHTLFFSNSNEEEYQTLFLIGSRRRKKSNKTNANSNIVKDTSAISTTAEDICNNPQCQNEIQIERATKPEEPAIYVIDNFLTNSELEYFDQKIASISFERSFVDNMEYGHGENDGDEESKNIFKSENGLNEITHKAQNQNSNAVQKQTGHLPSVSIDNASTSKCNVLSLIDTKKKNKKSKKRKRRTMVDDSHRTSTFYSFRKLHDTKISALEQRIANILGCWVHQIEALQLVRYLPGQFFGVHHDLGNLLDDDSVQLPRKELTSKRRLVTIFCYLNTLGDDEGGCTYFPKCSHLRVKPQRGRAVLWSNITPDGKADSRTIHAGEAVKSNPVEPPSLTLCTKNMISECSQGEINKTIIESRSERKVETKKYGLNIWICEE